MKCDFSGYATKNNLKCTDGRTIRKGAFKDCNGRKVPLVWNHLHNDPANIIGHAILEHRDEGTYAYCYLNGNDTAKDVRELLSHGDIASLSIYANQLVQRGSEVIHGEIREVSLVLAGANPGAYIDNLSFKHGDDYETVDDEAIIYTGLALMHSDGAVLDDEDDDDELSHADGKTLQDVFNTLNEEQKNCVYAMIGMAISDAEGGDTVEHSDEGGDKVKKNVFDEASKETIETNKNVLTHSQIKEIFDGAQKMGSLKASVLAHAQSYGIENIEILFPDAKSVMNTPDFIKRRTDWVDGVLSGTKHVPFSRIKSTAADITADEARARGYVKGNLKKEEVIKVLKRVTTPTTIYKKQKLDHDDIIDITDFDVVAWLKAEMRLMLDEEIARAILIGDGREADSTDKIDEEHLRPIWKEDDLYVIRVEVAKTKTTEEIMEIILRSMDDYEGSGSPKMYTAPGTLTDMLLEKDKIGRRYYNTASDVAAALGVSGITTVPLFKNQTRTEVSGSGATAKTYKYTLHSIIVNLRDYVVGADRGGQIATFDDFDIDYNQHKYLMETRISGCLVHPKSVIVVEYKEEVTTSGGD